MTQEPFIQLIVLPCHEYTLADLEGLAEEFNRVDILSRRYESQYKDVVNKRLNVHVDLAGSTAIQMINQHINDEADFYFITGGSNKVLPGFAAKLRDQINQREFVLLVKSVSLDGLLVNSHISNILCNFGKQAVDEKIEIWAKNHGLTKWIFESMDDLFTKESVTSG